MDFVAALMCLWNIEHFVSCYEISHTIVHCWGFGFQLDVQNIFVNQWESIRCHQTSSGSCRYCYRECSIVHSIGQFVALVQVYLVASVQVRNLRTGMLQDTGL